MINIDSLKESGKVIVDEEHDWGYQLRFVNTDKYSGKFLVLENSERGSAHYHKNKDETFTCIDGKVCVCLNYKERILKPGDSIHIPSDMVHWYYAPENWAVILEVATHDDDDDTYKV